jgi:thioredoxin reductase
LPRKLRPPSRRADEPPRHQPELGLHRRRRRTRRAQCRARAGPRALARPGARPRLAAQLDSDNGRLRRVRLDDGQTLDRDALFFYVGWRVRNDLARALGCELRDDGSIAVDADQATTIDRVYAAGNCSEPRALVPTAAGSGAAAAAAVAINARLCFEDADRAVARHVTAARAR